MKHSGLQRARQSTRKKMKKSLGPDFVDPSNLGLHGKETSSDVRCDICHEGLPINSKKDCINCKQCAIRAHANCVRTQLNVKYIKVHWLCANCRHCYDCEKSSIDQIDLVFCSSCKRSYHYDCTAGKGANINGKYCCFRCVKPSVVNTRLSTTTPRQNSSTAATPTTSASASSTSTTTDTTSSASSSASASASTTPNSNNSRTAPRSVNKSIPPESKSSSTTSHPSTSSNSSTPTPSTSRTSLQIKKEMLVDKNRARSHSNTPTDRQSRSDSERPAAQASSDRPVRSERASSIGPTAPKRRERPNLRMGPPFTPGCNGIVRIRMDGSSGPVMGRPGIPYRLSDLHKSQRDRLLKFMETSLADRTEFLKKKLADAQDNNDTKTNIDLPDVDMKDSFTDKPLTREQNEKSTDKTNSIKRVESERENVNKPNELSERVEKQSANENQRVPSEPASENSRNPMNVNKTNGTGVRGTSLLTLHSLPGNENEVKNPHSIPQKPNLPEKRKGIEEQGSGFVLSKPTELTEETAKLLKDSNGAKKLKLVLFERACKAESLLPAETGIWTTEDVFNFIRFIGFPDAADNFLDHQIDGKSLLLLSRRDVLTGFKLKLGPALKIYAHIFRLQRKRPALLLED